MSQPTPQNLTSTPLSFADRLLLVSGEVEKRISQTPTTNPAHLRARFWVSWIKRNVLDLPTGVEVSA